MGKTMVMAIWLIARAERPQNIPTRLVYVVDRRTVVDQATDIAEDFAYLLGSTNASLKGRVSKRRPEIEKCKEENSVVLEDIRKSLLGDRELAISTLRGQLADNREWSLDPTRPAIVIGTVDLIGSALLFSGYRSSFKRKPHEAGLLGMDSLLVLDEAHLSSPFDKLLTAIAGDHERTGFVQRRLNDPLPKLKPIQVIRMSATSGTENTNASFQLEDTDWADADSEEANPIKKRYEAKKTLRIVEIEDAKKLNEKLNEKLADEAVELVNREDLKGKRIVVFVRSPVDAVKVADLIRKHAKLKKQAGFDDKSVEVLTGTMRGLERDQLVEKPVLERFLDGDEKPGDKDAEPVFLVSTSAGEVGFDLNADHLVSDVTTLDSFIQRLGRVNRRGYGKAEVVLVRPKTLPDKSSIDIACKKTVELLEAKGDKSLSPQAIADWKQNLLEKSDKQIEEASAPKPETVELTDILLDAWSMTSIREKMPGRPEVGPWLRGIEENAPQTSVVWRAELDLDGFAELDLETVAEWFDAHRVLTHETLSAPTSDIAKWFIGRWEQLDNQQSKLAGRIAVLDRAGLELVTLAEIARRLAGNSKDNDSFLRGATLIIPESFGGIDKGMLDAKMPAAATPLPNDDEDEEGVESNTSTSEPQPKRIDVADDRGRYRERFTRSDDRLDSHKPLVASSTKPCPHARHRLTLRIDDEKTVHLDSYTPRVERPESGVKRQPLAVHVRAVHKRAFAILDALKLPTSNHLRQAVELAVEWHDHGKNRLLFQRTVGGAPADSVADWQSQTELRGDGKDQCLGKSGGIDRGRPARGYRHEFGSLREFTEAMHGKVSEEVFDLAAHLIASHHGRGRPHFPKGGFDPDDEAVTDTLHAEAMRRFGRLQRRYGWWGLAWLENLLRCADQAASGGELATEVDESAEVED